ncbi:hypothetical protein AYR56_10140 [Loigolactobacillus backii]|uniref:Sugar phosphotransferase n=1 Tax=Loigolactobacillus backii TaxID=375175 RepID=A0A192H2Q2_9LACO|nr:stealth family protein [Loigolactobacillus backii]ANK62507.1 hypothetical protein AYR53_06850 [Loigolactobacillus backii]ANK70481.1 hypothetical protein AYR56_10140 [Loigolactobacillus backii]
MGSKDQFPVDFIITWVDQSDPEWLAKFNKYSDVKIDGESERFRDYSTLRYLFRSIERFAPWVRKIFLVTDDQVPEWLNEDSPKIQVIFHNDIIPNKYLPTFNSNVIDLNLVNIPNLADHFVYFNDDMFLNAPVKQADFFTEKGLPRDTFAFNAIMPTEDFDHIFVNNVTLINKLYKKQDIMKTEFFKLFNFKNFEFNFLNLLLAPFPKFSRFVDPHIPISFRKDWIQDTLENFPDVINVTNPNRFRSKNDYSIWLFRYVAMLNGNFSVRSAHFGKGYKLSQINQVCADIEKNRHKLLNINDSDKIQTDEFKFLTFRLTKTFNKKFSLKCSFEK